MTWCGPHDFYFTRNQQWMMLENTSLYKSYKPTWYFHGHLKHVWNTWPPWRAVGTIGMADSEHASVLVDCSCWLSSLSWSDWSLLPSVRLSQHLCLQNSKSRRLTRSTRSVLWGQRFQRRSYMKQVRKTRGLGHSDGLKDLQDPEDNPMVLYMFFFYSMASFETNLWSPGEVPSIAQAHHVPLRFRNGAAGVEVTRTP